MLADSVALATKLQRDLPSDQADQALLFASEAVRAYLGQQVTQGTYTETHSPQRFTRRMLDGSREFWGYVVLHQRPLVSVASVTQDGDAVAYEIDTETNRLMVADDVVQVTVTYTAGYAVVPDDIRAVVLALAANEVLNVAQVAQQRLGDYSVTYRDGGATGGLTNLHKWVLNRYRPAVSSITQGD